MTPKQKLAKLCLCNYLDAEMGILTQGGGKRLWRVALKLMRDKERADYCDSVFKTNPNGRSWRKTIDVARGVTQ